MNLLEYITSYWRIALSLAVTIAFLLYLFSGQEPTTISDLSKIIAFSLTAILGLHLAESIDVRNRLAALRDDSRGDVRDVLREFDRYNTYLVEFRGGAEYAELFEGLTGEFISYNPHQFAQSVSLNEDEVVANMARRYKNRKFDRARFLICESDDYGQENLNRFMKRLHRIYTQRGAKRAVTEKVKVRILDKSFVDEPTFHLQYKQGQRCLIELRLPALTVGETPVPRYYLVTSSQDVWTHLQAYFDAQWTAATAVDLEQGFREIDNRSASRDTHAAQDPDQPLA